MGYNYYNTLNYKIFKLGSLYVNGKAQSIAQDPTLKGDIPQYSGTGPICIGNTVSGKAIPWVKPNEMNILVARQVLMSLVSWDELNSYSLVDGKEILIDGNRYICRLPKVGFGCRDRVEWSKAMATAGRANKLWNWKGIYFWGQEHELNSDICPVVGFHGSTNWNCFPAITRMTTVGYRPILEPKAPTIFSDHYICNLDNQDFCVMQTAGALGNMLLPQLLPLKEQEQKETARLFDSKIFNCVGNGKFLYMYSLLMDGNPVRQDTNTPVSYKKGASLAITDQFFGPEYLIQWTVFDGAAYAVKPLLKNIQPEELAKQGFLHN